MRGKGMRRGKVLETRDESSEKFIYGGEGGGEGDEEGPSFGNEG